MADKSVQAPAFLCVVCSCLGPCLWYWSPSPCSTPRIPAPWCLEDRQLHSAQLWSLSTSLLLLRSSSWWCRCLPPHTLWTISWIRTCKQYIPFSRTASRARFLSSGLQWAEPANLILWAKVTDLCIANKVSTGPGRGFSNSNVLHCPAQQSVNPTVASCPQNCFHLPSHFPSGSKSTPNQNLRTSKTQPSSELLVDHTNTILCSCVDDWKRGVPSSNVWCQLSKPELCIRGFYEWIY